MSNCPSCRRDEKSEAHEAYKREERTAWNERARTLRDAKSVAQRLREQAQTKYRESIRDFEEELRKEMARIQIEYDRVQREANAKYDEVHGRLWKEYEHRRAKELGLG